MYQHIITLPGTSVSLKGVIHHGEADESFMQYTAC